METEQPELSAGCGMAVADITVQGRQLFLEMAADLVGAPALRENQEKIAAPALPAKADVGQGRLAASLPLQLRANDIGRLHSGKNPGGGQVTFADLAFLELAMQGDLALFVLGEKDQPLGRQVEAVDRRRPVAVVPGGQ